MVAPSKHTTPPSANSAAEAAEFVEHFARVWAEPSPERLEGLVHSDVEFVQPMEPVVRGHREASEFWRRIFGLVPDLHGEVLSWGSRDGIVYIELRMVGTLGGRPIEWVVLDRIRLEHGKVRQRTAYSNPIPLIRAVVTRPTVWPRWLAAQHHRANRLRKTITFGWSAGRGWCGGRGGRR